MSEEETPKVGDVIEVPILRDADYRYFCADNIVVTHTKRGESAGIELHAVASQTAMVASQIKVTNVEPNSPVEGRPAGVKAAANQVHVGTVRMDASIAVEMIVALVSHMKRQGVGDVEGMRSRISEALNA